MPCPYITPPESRPNSFASAPGLSSSSTISGTSISTSLIFKYQQSTGYKQDEVVKIWTICPFHAEDRDEQRREKYGLNNCFAGAKAVRKAKAQRIKRAKWEKEWKQKAQVDLAMRGEKRKRVSNNEAPLLGLWSIKDGSWASWYEDRR